MSEPRYRRRSARVLLVDDADRVLLFRFRSRTPTGFCWLTPGGGVDRGEPLAVAAARELHEETGLRVTPDQLGAPVAATSGHADLGWARGLFRDDFFFHRVSRHEVDTSGWEPGEHRRITAHRWWPVTELADTADEVYPLGLAALLAGLLAGPAPTSPVTLPWHH